MNFGYEKKNTSRVLHLALRSMCSKQMRLAQNRAVHAAVEARRQSLQSDLAGTGRSRAPLSRHAASIERMHAHTPLSWAGEE